MTHDRLISLRRKLPQLLYHRRQSHKWALNRRLCGHHITSGRFGKETNVLHVAGIETKFLDCPACNLSRHQLLFLTFFCLSGHNNNNPFYHILILFFMHSIIPRRGNVFEKLLVTCSSKVLPL